MRRIAKVRCGVMVAAAVMAVRSVGAQAPAEELRKPYSELSARPMWASKVKEGLYVIRGPLGPCLPMPCPAVPTPVNPDGLLRSCPRSSSSFRTNGTGARTSAARHSPSG